MRVGVFVLALLLAFGILAWQLDRAGGLDLPLFDFVEYWAAGHLNVRGENPYDPDAVEALERQAGREHPGVLMWNPPWTLPLVMPFGLFDVEQVQLAQLLWLLMQFAALLFAVELLWRQWNGQPERRWLAWVVAFTFAPTLFAFTAGQISPLLLLGAAGFLHSIRREHWFLAAASLVLVGIKPHLALLVWPAGLLWALHPRRWQLIAWGTAIGLALTAVALLANPQVLNQYWHTLTTSPPAKYDSPTFGMVLRLLIDRKTFELQYLPPLLGLLWLAWYASRHASSWNWNDQFPLLLLVSMLTAAYGAWPFDLVLLLVPVLEVAAHPRRPHVTLLVHFLISIAAILTVLTAPFFWSIWLTPALLVAYILLRPGHQPAKTPLATCSKVS